MPDFIIGVDLGKTHDYTAINVLEVRGEPPEWRYSSRHLERLQIGTSYPDQVERVADLCRRLRGPQSSPRRDLDLELLRELGGTTTEGLEHGSGRRPDVRLVVDQTGVGQAVVDMMRDRGLNPVAVTITGGDAVTETSNGLRVPKRDLVGTLQVVTQTRRLRIAKGNPLASRLVDEMLAFKVSVNDRGHDSYGNDWRENPHDDLVLATALAAWYGESRRGHFQMIVL